MDSMEPDQRLRELFAKGEQVDINYGVPVRRYFRSCQELMRMAGVYYEEKNFENSYILYAKFIVLSFEKLKNHPDYVKVPSSERQANKKALMVAFDRAEKLKPLLKDKYQEEYTKHLEERALMVALAREDELRKREERARMLEDEERRQHEVEEKRRLSEQAMMDAFLLAQEQKKLEKERQAIEAEFSSKVTIEEDADDEIPLVPIDIAPPPPDIQTTSQPQPPVAKPRQQQQQPPIAAQQQPNISSYSQPKQPLVGPSPPSTQMKYQPTVPSRQSKPNTSHENYHVSPSTTSVGGSKPAIDRSLKPPSSTDVKDNSSSNFSSAAFGASLTQSKNKYGLRTIICPADLPSKFMRVAVDNTARNIETCGVIFGKLANEVFIITHVLVPHQTGAPDSCDTTREEDMWEFQDEYDGICLGWIHTHPSQTAFLSSVDLHTHYPYQCLMPESVAIVCSDKFHEIGNFMLTPDHGMNVIGKCRKSGFHPHPSNPPLFEACDHVVSSAQHKSLIVDWRNK